MPFDTLFSKSLPRDSYIGRFLIPDISDMVLFNTGLSLRSMSTVRGSQSIAIVGTSLVFD